MQRKDLLKRGSIRNAEYYNMVGVFDALHADSAKGKVFTDLISTIGSDANIKLAYRNLKTNKGAMTPGVDGKTFDDLKAMSEKEIVRRVRDKIGNYQPKAVRRVYIPKNNGSKRPLGIPTVLDRIVQQCVLQVMEPVCEAKFYRNSYGFRPNRSAKHAVAICYKMAQRSGLHYVVDVDIKGFFDNVDHGKLLKQIWALGIHDKNLISLISKMLKAPIEENGKRTVPDKGTPQGGVLSPLLANIVLNELDWWIASQWENLKVRKPIKSGAVLLPNGSLSKGAHYARLKRTTHLKECFVVRYADDFKIFCRNYDSAVRLKIATERWLMERLKLEVSPGKSKITNLRRGYSEFLGIKFRLVQKGGKWRVKSHMTDKAIKTQKVKLKQALSKACDAHEKEQAQHLDIIRYNQIVVGIHGYYDMATMITEDVHRLFLGLDKTMKCRLGKRGSLKKEKPSKLKGGMDEFFYQRYRASKQLRYANGIVVAPIAYCRTRPPMCFRPSVNQYTPEGRKEIHRMLCDEDYRETLIQLSENRAEGDTIELFDNRVSRFVAAKGRCELSGQQLQYEDVRCHHLVPKEDGGTDEYKNLRIVSKDALELIYSTDVNITKRLTEATGCGEPQRQAKLNKWRRKLGLEPVLLRQLD
jgi:group II intron reverse transcriptase/maturase